MSFSYVNLSRRLQYAVQAFSQTQFYYGNDPGTLYALQYSYISRDQAVATQTARGATIFGIYPFNRYARVELSGGVMNFSQQYNDPGLQQVADQYQQSLYGRTLFGSGTFMPLGAAYVQETTVFREYGPLAGNTVRVGYEYAPSVGNLLSRHTADVDARYYLRLATNGVLAFRARGFKSWGEFPGYLYFGGNSEMRGYDYLQFLGNKAAFANAELRFPLIEAALTPLGVIGGLRGVMFANIGGAGYEGVPMKFATRKPITISPLLGYQLDFTNLNVVPVYGDPVSIGGLKLLDGRASYGLGLETFALGFPIHFDWSWRTLLNKDWEDYMFSYEAIQAGAQSGSKWFRKPRFSIWIGYDF
jgi:outer membrane protein assembly factor BamA